MAKEDGGKRPATTLVVAIGSALVRDVIREVLSEEGPLKKDEVIKHVKKARFVKDNTILVNLNDNRYFKRLKDGRYAAA